MAIARIFANEDVVILKCPFRSRLVEVIKESIPRGARNWEPSEKVWEFKVEYLDDVIELCNRFFTKVVVEEWEAETSYKERGRHTGDRWSQVKEFMTKDTYKGLYRLLAKEYHPDKMKGDGEKMKKINLLFEEWVRR